MDNKTENLTIDNYDGYCWDEIISDNVDRLARSIADVSQSIDWSFTSSTMGGRDGSVVDALYSISNSINKLADAVAEGRKNG